MKIQDYTVQLAASHEASRSRAQESTTVSESVPPGDFRAFFERLAAASGDGEATARQRVQKMLQSLLEAILAAIDGKKCGENFAADADWPVPGRSDSPARGGEIAWQRTVTVSVSETESTTVCGSGRVRTADGRDIGFDLSLQLARDYRSSATATESGRMVLRDPLVLSFDGKSCELTDQRIRFDLNADGRAEDLPGLGAGSGFLVFDRNGNGRADDGSELFGAASGNGFGDLAEFDADRNGWIDEADPAWGRLAVWSGEHFDTLAQRGVGALYTGAVAAPFSLKNGANELLGQIRSAGLYLSEAGEVGQLQQVDLAVSASAGGAQQPGEGEQLTA